MGVKRSPLSGGERRCRDTEGRRRWRKGVCGAAGAAGPHLLHQSQSRQTHATAPQAGPAGREHPGGSRRAPRRPACAPASAAPLQGPHARSFPPPRSPSRSGRPSRLGSGRACPGTPLASALAQLAPLAGRYVPCRRAGGGQRAGVGPWERGRGDEGIPGTALQGPPRPPPGTVAQGSRPPAGAATGTHPSSPTFQPWHATGASIRSPVPGAVTIPSSPLQSAAQWQAGGYDTRGTGGRPLLLLSLSFFSLFNFFFFFNQSSPEQSTHSTSSNPPPSVRPSERRRRSHSLAARSGRLRADGARGRTSRCHAGPRRRRVTVAPSALTPPLPTSPHPSRHGNYPPRRANSLRRVIVWDTNKGRPTAGPPDPC